jgi:hypothetical protein
MFVLVELSLLLLFILVVVVVYRKINIFFKYLEL